MSSKLGTYLDTNAFSYRRRLSRIIAYDSKLKSYRENDPNPLHIECKHF